MSLKRMFWVFLVLWMVTGIALNNINVYLETDITPFGIVSFEFCGISNSCETALEQWADSGQLYAMLSLGLDYLYMIAYPGLFATSILLLQRKNKLNYAPPAGFVIGGCLAMTFTDAIENFSLIQIVIHGPQSPFPMLSGIMASIKFAIFFVALFWLLYLIVRNFLNRVARDA